MTNDLTEIIVADFVKNSWPCVDALISELTRFKSTQPLKKRSIHLGNPRGESNWDSSHFFLRASVEYSNPQLTLEELQGIIAARLLEVFGNHFYENGLHEVHREDLERIYEMLEKPPRGEIISFLLETDDVEPDRYSSNPLRESIVSSGQSAFPVASIRKNELKIDASYVSKYGNVLISKDEADLITHFLESPNGSLWIWSTR